MNQYILTYLPLLKRFAIIHKEKGDTHSLWRTKYEAMRQLQQLLGQKK